MCWDTLTVSTIYRATDRLVDVRMYILRSIYERPHVLQRDRFHTISLPYQGFERQPMPVGVGCVAINTQVCRTQFCRRCFPRVLSLLRQTHSPHRDFSGGVFFLFCLSSPKVWSYLYTTAGDAVKTSYLANGGNSPSKPPPLAGLGYGLPLRCEFMYAFRARVYRYAEQPGNPHVFFPLQHGRRATHRAAIDAFNRIRGRWKFTRHGQWVFRGRKASTIPFLLLCLFSSRGRVKKLHY